MKKKKKEKKKKKGWKSEWMKNRAIVRFDEKQKKPIDKQEISI